MRYWKIVVVLVMMAAYGAYAGDEPREINQATGKEIEAEPLFTLTHVGCAPAHSIEGDETEGYSRGFWPGSACWDMQGQPVNWMRKMPVVAWEDWHYFCGTNTAAIYVVADRNRSVAMERYWLEGVNEPPVTQKIFTSLPFPGPKKSHLAIFMGVGESDLRNLPGQSVFHYVYKGEEIPTEKVAPEKVGTQLAPGVKIKRIGELKKDDRYSPDMQWQQEIKIDISEDIREKYIFEFQGWDEKGFQMIPSRCGVEYTDPPAISATFANKSQFKLDRVRVVMWELCHGTIPVTLEPMHAKVNELLISGDKPRPRPAEDVEWAPTETIRIGGEELARGLFLDLETGEKAAAAKSSFSHPKVREAIREHSEADLFLNLDSSGKPRVNFWQVGCELQRISHIGGKDPDETAAEIWENDSPAEAATRNIRRMGESSRRLILAEGVVAAAQTDQGHWFILRLAKYPAGEDGGAVLEYKMAEEPE